MPNSWGRPLFWPRPFPNMGKKPTFDRKVVQTQFFYQNDCNWLLKRFPSVRGHFALKCFLNGLIGQLVILGRISQNITMLTSVRYLRGISYPNILQWVVRITKKKLQAQFHPEDLFLVVTPVVLENTLGPLHLVPLKDHWTAPWEPVHPLMWLWRPSTPYGPQEPLRDQ